MKSLLCGLVTASLLFAAGCRRGGTSDKPTVAYVTNGIANFWKIAEKGARDAAADPKINVHVEVAMPPKGVEDQTRMVRELLAKNVKGIAISPIDPDNQGDLLDEIAGRTTLITHDSDAPASKRLCYVGMDNYDAGRMCGKLVKEAIPEGGSVMIFVGRVSQANARLRRQGVIDELLDRSHDPKRHDGDVDAELKGSKYVILGTKTDGFDFAKAKQLAQDAMTKHPDLSCMVGLFEYNPPILLDAVREGGKLKKIKIVAFDENKDTLQGIIDGQIQGTIVQNPYKYGYESVRILAALARGDKSVLPASGMLAIPAESITRTNVEAYWKQLKERVGE